MLSLLFAATMALAAPHCPEDLGGDILLPVSAETLRHRLAADFGRLTLQDGFMAQDAASMLASHAARQSWSLLIQEKGATPPSSALLLLDAESSRFILTQAGLKTLLTARSLDPFFDLPVMLLTPPEHDRGKPHWAPYARWLLALAQTAARHQVYRRDPEAPVLDGLLAELRTAHVLAPRWSLPPPPPLKEALRLKVMGPLEDALQAEDYERLARHFASAQERSLHAYAKSLHSTRRPRFFRELLALQRKPLSTLALALAETDGDRGFEALLREFGARAALLHAMKSEIPGSPLIAEAEAGLRAARAALR